MSELTYERAKQLYTPYDEGQMRHLCALRDVEIDRLRVENAKLRELVQDMWFWHYEGHIDSESQERQMSHIDGVLDRMHKLGAEVDA